MSNLDTAFEQILRDLALPTPPRATVSHLGIDVWTDHRQELIRRLRTVPGVISVQSGGPYVQGPEWSQVWLETTLTERQVEDWMYAQKGIEYVGVFDRSAP